MAIRRAIDVTVANHRYPVVIGRQARDELGALISTLGGIGSVAVIADATVAGLHFDRLAAALPVRFVRLDFPAGEASKSFAQAEQLYDALAAARIERSDLVITFGGGVAGDLGGFVAATWMRGVRYMQVATTLEAAVDAAVGGKTAVNHLRGKNLIGAFHQPSAVVIDFDFLDTLPQRDFAAGLAESVKHAVIRDAAFLTWHEVNAGAIVRRDDEALTQLIAHNVAIKADVVRQDEREHRLRQILNYGHTIGHAIEHLLDYEMRHGECVSLGMIAENAISTKRGRLPKADAERICGVLASLGLPTALPRQVEHAEIVALTRQDKKARAGITTFVVPERIGEPAWLSDVDDEEIIAAMQSIARCEGQSI